MHGGRAMVKFIALNSKHLPAHPRSTSHALPCNLSHVRPARKQVKARAQSRRSRVGVALPTGGSGATTTPDYSLSDASTSQPQSIEGEAVTATEGASLPLALLARDAPKMRAAAELLNAWQIEPHDLWCGELLGRGGGLGRISGVQAGLRGGSSFSPCGASGSGAGGGGEARPPAELPRLSRRPL